MFNMKKFFKKIIVFIITFQAKLVLKKYQPKIVGITGTVGKTSAKDAIAAVLSRGFRVRKTTKSYNSEVGVPLVILGCENVWFNPFLWFWNILKGFQLIFFKTDYPQWLVLELGVERPGDMTSLVSWIKPDISVITALSEIPPHVEFFTGPEALVKEKVKILKNLSSENTAILNNDDVLIKPVKDDKMKARVITYGFEEGADLLASNYRIVLKEENGKAVPEGLTFKVDYKGSSVPIRLFNTFGRHHVYPGLAALAAGAVVGFNLVDMAESLTRYNSPPGRLKLIEGEKATFILDDTYNASPAAVRAAIEVLKEIPAKRKIAVLGDMLELGKYAVDAHRAIAKELSGVVDLVFTVGPRSKFIATELKETGFEKKNIFEFSMSDEAKSELEKVLREGDLILVKGSQAMRMERIVEEIMAHPEKKEGLLVRQEKTWKGMK